MLRRAIVFSSKAKEVIMKEGYFHTWGTYYGKTIAVFEDNEGNVWLVKPDCLKFTTEPQIKDIENGADKK